MSYTISTTNGTILTTIADQTFDTSSTALTLVGRGAVNYGTKFAENFVYLMENFADTTPPNLPLVGQLWYDLSTGLMKFYVGNGSWTALSNSGGLGATAAITQGPTLGGNVSGTNRIAGSTGFALTVGTSTTTVNLTLSEGKVISIACAETIPASSLPATIVMENATFNIASRFPNGVQAGVTLATDTAGYVNAGLATSSLYADVAERYEVEGIVEPGDVVSLGGSKEIVLCAVAEDTEILGVISTDPALLMNSTAGDDSTHPAVALVGRVPCKVIGYVRKFQRLVASGIPGIAKAAEGHYHSAAVIGRALESKTTIGQGMIEIVLGRA